MGIDIEVRAQQGANAAAPTSFNNGLASVECGLVGQGGPAQTFNALLAASLTTARAGYLDQPDHARLDIERDISPRHKPCPFPHVLRGVTRPLVAILIAVNFLTELGKNSAFAAIV